jgi:pimeloyl-ACP methyl ester carboxylesterase
METVRSNDGTSIAFEKVGSGPALVLVDGAMCYRDSGPARPLAKVLAEHFTVFIYDRRGRGDSGNQQPFAVQREVEDLAAVLNAAGGSAFVYGISSGAVLALEAANARVGIQKLALYEAPFIVDDSRTPIPPNFLDRLNDDLRANRRPEMIKSFMKLVGVPGIFIFLMRLLPAWSKLIGVAHTLPHDITLVKDYELGQPLPANRWGGATMPTLVMDGGKSPKWMRNAMSALAKNLPNAEYKTLPGQTHMIKPKALLGPLLDFFKGPEATAQTLSVVTTQPEH